MNINKLAEDMEAGEKMVLNPCYVPRLIYDYLMSKGYSSLAEKFSDECPYLSGLKYSANATGKAFAPITGSGLEEIVSLFLESQKQPIDSGNGSSSRCPSWLEFKTKNLETSLGSAPKDGPQVSTISTPTTEAAVSKSVPIAPSHSNAGKTQALFSINIFQNSNTNSPLTQPPEMVKNNSSTLVNKPAILHKQQVWLPLKMLQSATSQVPISSSPQTAITLQNSTISTSTTNSITMHPASLSRPKPVAVKLVSSAPGVSRLACPRTTITLQKSTITSPATNSVVMHPVASSGSVPVTKQNPQLVNLRNLPDGQAAQNHQIIRLPAQPNIRRPNNYGRTPVPLVSAPPPSVVCLNRETGQCRLIRAVRVNGYQPAGAGITNSNDPKNKKVIHLVKLKATPTPPQPNMLNVLIRLPGKNVRPANLPTNPDAALTGGRLQSCSEFLTDILKIVEKITPSVASAVKKLMLDLMNSHVAMEEFRSKFQDLLKNDLTGDHLLFLKGHMPALKTFLVANMAAFSASASKEANQQLDEQVEASGSQHVDSSTVPVSQVSIATPPSHESNSPTPQEDEIQTAAYQPSSEKVVTSVVDSVVNEVAKSSQPPPTLTVTQSSDVSVEPVEPSKDLIGTTSCEVTDDFEANWDSSTLTADSPSVHSEGDVEENAVEEEKCTEKTTTSTKQSKAPPTDHPVVDEIVKPTHLLPNLNVTDSAEVPMEPVEPSKDLMDTTTSCEDVNDLEASSETSTLKADSPSIPSKDAVEENCTEETTPSTHQTNAPSEKQSINEAIAPAPIPIEVTDLEADSPAPAVEADPLPCHVTAEESSKIIISESSGKSEMSNTSLIDCILLDSDGEDSQISTGIPTPQPSPSSSASATKSSQEKPKRKAESDSDVEITEVLPPKRHRFSLRPCSVVLRTAFQMKIDQRDFSIGN